MELALADIVVDPQTAAWLQRPPDLFSEALQLAHAVQTILGQDQIVRARLKDEAVEVRGFVSETEPLRVPAGFGDRLGGAIDAVKPLANPELQELALGPSIAASQ